MEFLERIVFGEIEGKNRAIHAYNGIIWKIRAGFLILLFSGWAILLKRVVETSQTFSGRYIKLSLGLLLFSLGFAFGAWIID